MPKSLSKLAGAVKASTTIAIDALYKQMKAEGVDVIGFGAGEPDFNTPDFIKQAAVEAIKSNKTRYTPAAGTLELRRAICQNLSAEFGLDYEPGQIVVSSGAKHNLYIALATLCDRDDEVILPAPFWVSYDEQIRMVGARPVLIPTTAADDFKITRENLWSAISPKTKAIIINSPSNPTGMVYSRDELIELCTLCAENDIYIISDEIYCHLVYDGEFTSVPSLSPAIKDLTILINGVSKSYAMTGWRVGYAAAPKHVAEVMSNFQSHSTSAPCSVSQEAALAALTGDRQCVVDMRDEFKHRRDLFCERASKIPGVKFRKPQGAFYVMLDVSSTFKKGEFNSADDFAQALLREARVAVVPCEGFAAPAYIRMSYAASDASILEGLDRLDAFMRKFS